MPYLHSAKEIIIRGNHYKKVPLLTLIIIFSPYSYGEFFIGIQITLQNKAVIEAVRCKKVCVWLHTRISTYNNGHFRLRRN